MAASRRLTQAGCDKLRQAGRVDVQGVAAMDSYSSQHLLPATDRGPEGRLAALLIATRAAAAADTRASTGPTPDAVDATPDS